MRTFSHFIAAAVVLTAAPALEAGAVYSTRSGFLSPNANPNGVWTYGWSSTLTSSFNLDTAHTNFQGLDFWEGSAPGSYSLGYPLVYHNGTNSVIDYVGTVLVQPGQLVFHPGPAGQFGIIRFTAPEAGTFVLSTAFSGLDFVGPTSTDVHVLLNGSAIFNGTINGYGGGSGLSFSKTLTLAMGDRLDFAVGYGTNHDYTFDSTAITATLSSVPEPSSMASMLIGGLTLATCSARRCRSFRRKK